jgi:hypothetical protein
MTVIYFYLVYTFNHPFPNKISLLLYSKLQYFRQGFHSVTCSSSCYNTGSPLTQEDTRL